jgi:hypothetical protein
MVPGNRLERSTEMFTVTAFTHFVDGLRAIHNRQRTERILRDLPPHLREDIGLDRPPHRGRRRG